MKPKPIFISVCCQQLVRFNKENIAHCTKCKKPCEFVDKSMAVTIVEHLLKAGNIVYPTHKAAMKLLCFDAKKGN